VAELCKFVPDSDEYDFNQYIIILMDIIDDYHKKGSLTIGTDYEVKCII